MKNISKSISILYLKVFEFWLIFLTKLFWDSNLSYFFPPVFSTRKLKVIMPAAGASSVLQTCHMRLIIAVADCVIQRLKCRIERISES